MQAAFLYTGAGVIFAWGLGHLFPTRGVIAGFGPLSPDNTRILTMEWVAEGLTFIFAAALIIAVTWSDMAAEPAEDLVYRVTVGLLMTIGIWTAMTGARTKVIWFKMCPVVMTVSSGLLIAASLLWMRSSAMYFERL